MENSGETERTYLQVHHQPDLVIGSLFAWGSLAMRIGLLIAPALADRPTISGWLQVRYGFGPPFIGTIILYILSVILYWAFFWRGSRKPIPVLTPGD